VPPQLVEIVVVRGVQDHVLLTKVQLRFDLIHYPLNIITAPLGNLNVCPETLATNGQFQYLHHGSTISSSQRAYSA
jgi:hypothetical protein